jgi:broad specificity phosphatase PhoE
MSTPAGVLLARHGETDDNVPPLRFQGWRDTPLNETGRRQARQLARRVADLGIAALFTSDLSRARETAEIVGAELKLDLLIDPRLREGNRGQWEGRLFDDVAEAEPERLNAYLRAGAQWRFPGGESLQEQQDRVSACVEEIRHSAPAPALAVCHGGSIRVMLCRSDPRGLAAFHDFQVPNTAMVSV